MDVSLKGGGLRPRFFNCLCASIYMRLRVHLLGEYMHWFEGEADAGLRLIIRDEGEYYFLLVVDGLGRLLWLLD